MKWIETQIPQMERPFICEICAEIRANLRETKS